MVLDPDSSPEPSVERVAGVGHSMGGKIGTHMLLQVPPRASVMRPWA
jgi:pimeloyl-ACP methyl ester carboxylesterase